MVTLPDVVVQPEWLRDHLDAPALRIFDCTTWLREPEPGSPWPYRPEPARAEYDAGHIPGAGFLDLPGELSDPHGVAHFMLPAPAVFAAVMGRHGIGAGTAVVLYSRDRLMWSTRVWWMLHVMGFDQAAVLDGGFEAWLAGGHPVGTEPSSYPEATFVPAPRSGPVLDRAAVLAGLDQPGTVRINTLGAADFEGAGPSRYGRPGRIPGSVNLPWATLTDPETGKLIPLAEAEARLRELGVLEAERTVCYCGGGISATMAYFLLHRLGHPNLALYDASLGEWARDPDLPMERG